MKLIFDIETNGLLVREGDRPEMDTIWCISTLNIDTGEVRTYGPEEIGHAVVELKRADELIGHNIINFDLPAIRKVYPKFEPKGKITDTLVLSRVLWADRRDRDLKWLAVQPDAMPRRYLGSHSLGAYGYRLGVLKTEYEGGWDQCSQEMLDYCEQDVLVTLALYDMIKSKNLDPRAWELEHAVAHIIRRQTEYGFRFDSARAADLYSKLCGRRSELGVILADMFPDWEELTPFIPKANNAKLGYEKGVSTFKSKTIQFNPNSRDHIANRLKDKYNWMPTEFTPEGKPRVDEVVLEKLSYPEAKLLAENFLLTKRIGQLAEGQNAWLKLERNGRLHGTVNTNGAVTGRMTHANPNMAQVPSTRALYGAECRSLFVADEGFSLVGCDADALELRCLASYMAHFDGGDYVKTVLDGKKEDGTDTHSRNAKALACDRDTAKTWFYAFIYGAGSKKLGSILGGSAKVGAQSKKRFLAALPALGTLVETVQQTVEQRGYLKGLDGRPLYVRSSHAALNTLLQAAGAVIMKQALVTLDKSLHNLPAAFVANVHDEWQIQVKKGYEDEVGRRAVEAIRSTERSLNLRCPMDANYVVGQSWAETH